MKNGTIYSLIKNKYIGSIGKDGYIRVAKLKGYKHSKLHLYIWMVANGREIPDGYDIHHIDGNKLNNSIHNLILLTTHEHHLLHIKERNSFVKENNPFYGKTHSEESKQKMSNNRKDKKKVAQYTLDGKLVKIWDSISSCDKYGFKKSCVHRCCNNKLEYYKGFIWRYYNG